MNELSNTSRDPMVLLLERKSMLRIGALLLSLITLFASALTINTDISFMGRSALSVRDFSLLAMNSSGYVDASFAATLLPVVIVVAVILSVVPAAMAYARLADIAAMALAVVVVAIILMTDGWLDTRMASAAGLGAASAARAVSLSVGMYTAITTAGLLGFLVLVPDKGPWPLWLRLVLFGGIAVVFWLGVRYLTGNL